MHHFTPKSLSTPLLWLSLLISGPALSDGGMVIGGPLNGSILPGANGGMVIGGPLNGSIVPGERGGMVIGGPMNGSIMPGDRGGMVVGCGGGEITRTPPPILWQSSASSPISP